MTDAIETQLAKTVAEVAEKDEEIASLQHAGEEVEAEHLAACSFASPEREGGAAPGQVLKEREYCLQVERWKLVPPPWLLELAHRHSIPGSPEWACRRVL